MTVVLVALGVATLLEIALSLISGIWRERKYIVPLIVFSVSFGSGGLFASKPNLFTGLLLIISAYRVFNVLRITEARIHEKYLRRVSRLTSLWLIGLQLVTVLCWWFDQQVHLHRTYWVLLAAVQLLAALALSLSTLRTFTKTRPFTVKETYADRELPTVSVAIPARNEDQQLEDCLRSVLASDYPKLEVIVLDDCSQDRTSQIIRNFAHDGVRFVPGKPPEENWLAKNQAYAQLADEASGDLILFCGVDVRFAPQSIRQLITLMKAKQKQMLSLTPVNDSPGLSFSQVIRYYWELALPRRLFNRPPVMSSCWLTDAAFLRKSGGFAAVNNAITPEAFFARCAVQKDVYTFIRSTTRLGIVSVKSGSEQKETAIRVRYPQLHKRPELVLLIAFAELLLLLAPYAMVIIGFWGVFGPIAEAILIVTCVLLIATYRVVTYATSPANRWYAAPLFPVTVLIDVLLLNYSMAKYEFSTVEWKGRNICIPALQVQQRLPALPKTRT